MLNKHSSLHQNISYNSQIGLFFTDLFTWIKRRENFGKFTIFLLMLVTIYWNFSLPVQVEADSALPPVFTNLSPANPHRFSDPIITQMTLTPQLSTVHLTPLVQPSLMPKIMVTPEEGPGWKLDNSGVLTLDSQLISPTGSSVDQTSWPWDQYRDEVTKVIVKSSIKLSNTTEMFAFMPLLTNVQGLNNLDTEQVFHMNGMFNKDEELQSLDVTGWDMQNVHDLSYMFSGCSKLTVIKGLENWEVNKVHSMTAMFYDCFLLNNLDLSHWTTSINPATGKPYLQQIAYMFDGDRSLTTIDVGGLDVSQVQDFTQVFAQCDNLATINGLENWSTDNATSIFRMFYNDSPNDAALKTLNVSKFKVDKVQDFHSLFQGCNSLTTIKGIENWKTSAATNMSNMFAYDYKLKSLDLSNFDLTNINNQKNKDEAGLDPAKNIGSGMGLSCMFYSCKSLTNIDGTNNWKTPGVTDVSYMFAYNDTLRNLDLSNFDVSQVTDINDMFVGDAALEELIINKAGFNAVNASNFDQMFYGCNALKEITNIENFKTSSQATSMNNMFAYDNSLKNLDLTNFNVSKVTDMRDMFASCGSLTEVKGMDTWNMQNVVKMDEMFIYDRSLLTATLNNHDAANNLSCVNTFFGCDSLQTVDLSHFNNSNAQSSGFIAYNHNLWKLVLGVNTLLTNSVLDEAPSDNKDMPSLFPDDVSDIKQQKQLNESYISKGNGKWQEVMPGDQQINPTGDLYTTNQLYQISGTSSKIRTFIWSTMERGLTFAKLPSIFNLNAIWTYKDEYNFDNNQDETYEVIDSRFHRSDWKVTAKATKLADAHGHKLDTNLILTDSSHTYVIDDIGSETTIHQGKSTATTIYYPWSYKAKLKVNPRGSLPEFHQQYHMTVTYSLEETLQ